MTLMTLPLAQVQMVFLIFLRVSAIFMTAPLLDSRSVPFTFKVGLALALSMIMLPAIRVNAEPYQKELVGFVVGLAGEVLLGITIGFSVRVLFSGIQLAGQLIGFQMGFSIANVMDTLSTAQVSIIAELKNILAVLIFLSVNGHYWLLSALVESFDLVPPFQFAVTHSFIEEMTRLTSSMFIIAVKIGAPVIVALLLTSVSLGLAARIAPQVNIFVVSFPINVAVGLIFLGFSVPLVANFLGYTFGNMGQTLGVVLRGIAR